MRVRVPRPLYRPNRRLPHPWLLLLLLAVLRSAHAADTRPVVGPGATKEEAITAYGWPTGQSQLGAKEILNYPQGSITLANGRVERVDFSPNVPWPAPRPRPGATTQKPAEAKSFDPWTTSLPDAVAQAAKQHARILAAFLGSDWSPPSKRFLTEVATHPDFVERLMGDFVFLKLDFPTRIAQPPELKNQNEALRARCDVTTYPALVVISPRGDPLAVVNLTRETTSENYREQVIAAVAEARDLLKLHPPVEAPEPAIVAAVPEKDAPPAPRAPDRVEADGIVQRLISSASWTLGVGLGAGGLLAILLLWWMWRGRAEGFTEKPMRPEKFQPQVRLKDLPTTEELKLLPAERLRLLVAALFEANGYSTVIRTADPDVDIELRRRGHTKANVIVCCRPASRGVIGAKQVREFFGSVIASGVEAGWIVTTGGFADDARSIAEERGIELIDGDGLLERLRQLPVEALGDVLARTGA